MSKYLFISAVLFLLLWVGLRIAIVIYGGDTVVPVFWMYIIVPVLANTVVAFVMAVYHVIRKM